MEARGLVGSMVVIGDVWCDASLRGFGYRNGGRRMGYWDMEQVWDDLVQARLC